MASIWSNIMKRFLALFLITMTFVSCGGSMFDAVETAEINLPINFVDSDRASGDIYEVTLDFVGTAPICDKFEKTQTTANPEKITYSITGLHAGDKVQLKLSIKKNGALIAEGVSQEKTIEIGRNNLTITVKRMHDWVFVYDNRENKLLLTIIDKLSGESKKYNNQELVIDDFTSGSVKDFCTDDKGNIYVFMVEQNGNQEDEGRIYRYRPGNGDYREKQLLYPGFDYEFYSDPSDMFYSTAYDSGDMYYDSKEDALYVMGPVSVEGYPYYCTYKFEKPAESTGLAIVDINDPYKRVPAITDGGAYSRLSMAVYDNTVYYAGRLEDPPGTFSLIVKTDDKQSVLLKDYTNNISSWVDGLDIKQPFSTDDYKLIKDMVVNETGIYILLNNTKDSIPFGGGTGYSRGALIKVDLDFTTARAIGWSNSTQHIRSMYSEETDPDRLTFYSPKSIKDGFYGPQKILAIKPKELVFADDGSALYMYGNNSLGVKQMNNIVSVDLEQLSYTSIETVMKLSVEPSLSGLSDASNSNYAESWN